MLHNYFYIFLSFEYLLVLNDVGVSDHLDDRQLGLYEWNLTGVYFVLIYLFDRHDLIGDSVLALVNRGELA